MCCAQAHSQPDVQHLNTDVPTCPGECEREASSGQLRAPLMESRVPEGPWERLGHTKAPPRPGRKGPLLALEAFGIGGQARWRWLAQMAHCPLQQ